MNRSLSLLRNASGFLTGALFGVGLAVAQMTNPQKVLDFLDVTGRWDPSLLLVLGGAVVLSTLAFRWILSRSAPLLDRRFHLPHASRVDVRLIAGSAIFGLGWGLIGYCPGPAIASLGFANPEALWVVPAMAAGVALQRWREAVRAGAAPATLQSQLS